jgi:hypothetical protein
MQVLFQLVDNMEKTMAIVRTRTFQVMAIDGTLDKVCLYKDLPNHRPLTPTDGKEGYFLESTQECVEVVSLNQFLAKDGQIYTIVE